MIRFAQHARLAGAYLPAYGAVAGDGPRTGLGRAAPHVNPATGRVQAQVAIAGPEDVDEAVAAARAAQRVWRATRVDLRRDALLRLAGLVRRDAGRFAALLTLEAAVPAATAQALPARAADYLAYYAGYADKLEGRVVPVFPEAAFDYTLPEPVGVVAALTTWNGGVSALARKAAPALAAGCAVVAKPSELAPFSALLLGELALEAGLPPGLLQVLPGDAEAGAYLAGHPGIDKITFTGGSAAGQAVARAAAAHTTPMLLELGGKSANLVFPDADLEAAARFAAALPMSMAGQGCVFPTRLYVHEDVYAPFLDTVARTVAALPVGDPLDPATAVGPLISAAARTRVLAMIDAAAKDAGAVRVTGGAAGTGDLEAGHFVHPCLVEQPDHDAEIARCEVFGPVLCAWPFRDEAHALDLANATGYGLAGYVFTRDVARAHRVAAALDAGYVSVNGFAALPASAPFGGRRGSGHGREGGAEGLREFVSWKNVYLA
ncbi:aldehyde dehydrogenase family protein [Yinghuangia soli]|uniref:Aldehyde dehydrogenase family protein n=1 Tax=Yinghuangia soli TaxID=2908204 RepID=A0AA41PXE1_9ACTN|nr:aldehyde dehydrogenase family protein [Yinghuangia soli]MCF2527648.1 aldehyde dehydrogenase family protein [Yinghuangia soli]